MRISGPALALTTCLAILACGKSMPEASPSPPMVTAESPLTESSPASPEAELERARGAANALAAELMGTLSAELAAGGPVAAIRVCSEVAPEVAAAQSGPDLTVRRVTARVRNPADAPDEWERSKLGELESQHLAGELPPELWEVFEGTGGAELRYLRPLVVQELCLQCHGDPESFPPEVTAVLAEHYPDDRAVGYEVGDFRGAVSVRVALGR